MLLARHHGKAGTANRITGGLHASAGAAPFTTTGSSTHTKITQSKQGLAGVVGACREPARRCTACKKGGKEGRKEGNWSWRGPHEPWHTGEQLVDNSHIDRE